MVDYVAVLRRTIDALPKNTPDIRERVYAKARSTVQSKLAMINPPPSQALIAKQMSGLEAAINTVEADYAVALEEDDFPSTSVKEIDALSDMLGSMPSSRSAVPTSTPKVEEEPYAVAPDRSRDARDNGQDDLSGSKPVGIGAPESADRGRLPETATLDFPQVAEARNTLASAQDSFDSVFGNLPRAGDNLPSMPSLDDPVMPPVFKRTVKAKSNSGRVLLPLLGLAMLAGAGALAWSERDRITAFLQPEQTPVVAAQTTDAPQDTTTPPATEPATPAETPAATDAPETPAADAAPKFTQRLNADGTEIDAGDGVAGGEQSVAQLEPAAEPPVAPSAEAPAGETPAEQTPVPDAPAIEAPAVEAPVAETPAVETPAAEALPVGQKAIFYEERTSGAAGSARTGAVVWSVVRESPGNDRPPEPAVRGELSIPEAGLNVRMTLRRNADTTLPASHILELIMTVPDDFAGGTIEDVQRVNLKPSEESAGAALSATPVKVADKFFLVALENNPAAIKANLALLRDQSWIDLPVVYRSGRRALFTMEKGLVGDQVFKQVLEDWDAAPLN